MEQQPVKQNNPMAIASLVLGIVSVALCWLGYWAILALACGVVGIILAVKGRKSNVQKGLATAGLVLSIIGTALSGILFVCVICAAATVTSAINSINY